MRGCGVMRPPLGTFVSGGRGAGIVLRTAAETVLARLERDWLDAGAAAPGVHILPAGHLVEASGDARAAVRSIFRAYALHAHAIGGPAVAYHCSAADDHSAMERLAGEPRIAAYFGADGRRRRRHSPRAVICCPS